MNYGYDNDGLLTRAGLFTITRRAENGLPDNVTGETLTISRDFNDYGETDGEQVRTDNNGMRW